VSADRAVSRVELAEADPWPANPLSLVVEDEPAQREVLAYNIKAEGYRGRDRRGGDEALIVVRETPPDVIILDWMLPNVSGIEVCRQLKMSGDTRASRHHAVGALRGSRQGARAGNRGR
jgi:two-component system phosphate regulon response regulator PhoB